ncbi:hypothetical protein DP202_02195 [Enterobacter cloacae]|uniref:Uncharacterized protein n=1 Tax=Enterobacter cloacae TaxID=550 RepID=A0A330GLI8_ENTCL|nr:hypothetical protein CEP65_003645 [Enterobacter hormaechei]PVU49746.1 hypothetical protein CP955_16695 [Enterobacter sp. HN503E2II]PVU50349.1 hypothetical protein CP954_01955 [Enterobacter sp. PN108E5IIB]RAZ72282.1 hypothetical protein DP202_02195 [Enterobacter cloacae]
MMKSVAQLPLKPINYDGVHAIPINECVKNAAHETDLRKPTRFRVPWHPCRANLKLRGNILYTTTGDVVSSKRFIGEIIRVAALISGYTFN